MKTKVLTVSLFVFCSFGASAQILTGDSFAKYDTDKYDGKADHKHQYVQAADGLKSRYELDKNDQLTYSVIIDCPNTPKDKLYDNINGWFTKAFGDKTSTITTNSKESGTLSVNTTLKNVVTYPHQIVSVNMITKINIKDDKIRLTCTIKDYVINTSSSWNPKKCYPFYDEQDELRKKIGASAYVAGYAFAEIVQQQLTDAAKPKVETPSSDDDW